MLFGVLWRRDDHGMADLPKHPVMQRWWAHMADIMETRAGQRAGRGAAGNRVPYGVTMAAVRHVAVIDIGKTNAKVALVDLERRAEIDVRRTPNAVSRDGPYPHFDIERLWSFILDSLGALNREQRDRCDLGHHAWRDRGAARCRRQSGAAGARLRA